MQNPMERAVRAEPALDEPDISRPPEARSRATRDEKEYARHLLLERIRLSRGWVGSAELKVHLERHTDWGARGSPDSRSRTVDNWLKRYRHLADTTGLFRYETLPEGIRYRGPRQERMTIEVACMTLLAERLLDEVLPASHLESGLVDVLRGARERLAEHERQRGRTGEAVRALVERIAIVQRGRTLERSGPAYAFAARVSGAILQRRCLDAIYAGGERRRLHPFALILRHPKLYLLAVDDRHMGADAAPRLFLGSRFDELSLAPSSNRVPESFSVDRWIAERGFEIPLALEDGGRRFELVFRVHAEGAGNLVRDLADFPLGAGQRIERESGGSHRVSVPDTLASVSLIEWILGRQSQIEVLAPKRLRRHVACELETMLRHYR